MTLESLNHSFSVLEQLGCLRAKLRMLRVVLDNCLPIGTAIHLLLGSKAWTVARTLTAVIGRAGSRTPFCWSTLSSNKA
jgi:hypothetical protein